MNKDLIFQVDSGNNYFYFDSNTYYIPQEFIKQDVNDKCLSLDDYYSGRNELIKTSQKEICKQRTFNTKIEPDSIKKNLGNLKQILFELTDQCNLSCEYCGYRDFYDNYDNRNVGKINFEKIKSLIDYLSEFWRSNYNQSYNNSITVGFYGGEPLIEFDLIVKTIEYLDTLEIDGITFNYNMTTNAILLDKYMNFLHERRFNILISLDGNEIHNSYRITKNGKNSFPQIISNVRKMRDEYPDFFRTNVNFNAVLHDKNSVKGISEFIFTEFEKIPRIAELSMNGVADNSKERLRKMFRSKLDDSNTITTSITENDETDILLENPEVQLLNSFLDKLNGNTYNHVEELFPSVNLNSYVPTGTCKPFEKKLFITVNGKMLACEKIGHTYTLGLVTDHGVEVDINYISDTYNQLYLRVINLCESCFFWNSCGQCIFKFEEDKKPICSQYTTINQSIKYLSERLSFLESKPFLHERLITETLNG